MDMCSFVAFFIFQLKFKLGGTKMNQTAIEMLEYNKIKELLIGYAISEKGKEAIRRLKPSVDIQIIEGWMKETTEARMILDCKRNVPIHKLSDIENIMNKLGKGNALLPDELAVIAGLLVSGKRLKKYMDGMQSIAPTVSAYTFSLYELEDVVEEIEKCIENDRVHDKASSALYKIRKKIQTTDEKIKSKVDNILTSPTYAKYIQDAIVSMRDGRYVIPVKKEYRRNIDGHVLDTSASGSTLFIEPAGIHKLQEELNILKIDEENEVYKILSFLTGIVESYYKEITINVETIAHYDFIFAKAKYSKVLDGMPVQLNVDNYINIKNGRHPLIGKSAIPLNFVLGDKNRGLIITGPNTGGKTVVLKTVGLLTMMVQSGLHVPVANRSEFAIFRDILVDIGDGQSIEQSLSTFSSHIRNISSIIECADPYTLVILDELGAGTDPGEGTGLAVAILETIFAKKATIIATTHYGEIKDYAEEKDGFINGCMAFDIQSLQPLYKLQIGKAGESNAFLIALRLGIGHQIIERAHEFTYKEKKGYKDFYKEMKAATVTNIEVEQSHKKQIDVSREIKSTRKKVNKQKIKHYFQVGDCVYVSSMNKTGIVCELENGRGDVGVMVMKKKFKINRKRLSLYIEGKELYPEDYDLDVVLESKENRKKRHQMSRKHNAELSIETPKKD